MATNAEVSGQVVVIDTSVWVSSLLPNDSNHILARNWISQHISSGGSLVAPALLVVETAAAVARVTQDPALARSAISQIYSFPTMQLLPIDHLLLEEAADVAIRFSLKAADSFYVAVTKQLGIPLVTFDNEQLTRPVSIVATIRP